MDQVEQIVRAVLARLGQSSCSEEIPVETSARHVHLSSEDLKALFGLDKLEEVRPLSQPGQFLSGSRVRLIGPKGCLENVSVLGPVRKVTQVEISATDARSLGIKAPVRLSGHLEGAAAVWIQAGDVMIQRKAAIVAERHIHMTPDDAARFGVSDGQRVSVRVSGSRPLILEEVPCRVTEASALTLHLDTDEANAAGVGKDTRCRITGSCMPVCDSISSASCAKTAAPAGQKAVSSTIVHSEAASENCFTPEEKLITEGMIAGFAAKGITCLHRKKGQLITPAARDALKLQGIRLEEEL